MPTKSKNLAPRGSGRLRILGGTHRGRVLRFPEADGLRPTGNRVRETLFNWLAPLLPGSRCLDAFAGSGALGFEALSRGARHCTFIEVDAQVAQALTGNVSLLKATAEAEVVHGDLLAWLKRPATLSYDLVFLDPPFAAGFWQPAVAELERGWLAPQGWAYVECPRGVNLSVPEHWYLHREKHAGQVTYRLYGNDRPV